MSTSLVVVFLLSSFQLARIASYSLVMSPNHMLTSEDLETVSFACTADTALTGCQFIWRNTMVSKTGPPLDLSRGSMSQSNRTDMDRWITGYSYTGRGLEAGDCGVSLGVQGVHMWMVACRVRAETGGWTYAWADLFTRASSENLPITVTPREAVVLPGGEARLTLKAQEPLHRCDFNTVGLTRDLHAGNRTGPRDVLQGRLEGSECDITVTDVSEADNGLLWVFITDKPNTTKADFRWLPFIVARPPSAPILNVVYTDAGFTATCVVHEGRPLPNITWVLGDVVVRQDSLDDSPGNAQDEWRWPWMQGSVLQTLTLGLRAQDNGKVLKCVASHVALPQPLEATEIISVTDTNMR